MTSDSIDALIARWEAAFLTSLLVQMEMGEARVNLPIALRAQQQANALFQQFMLLESPAPPSKDDWGALLDLLALSGVSLTPMAVEVQTRRSPATALYERCLNQVLDFYTRLAGQRRQPLPEQGAFLFARPLVVEWAGWQLAERLAKAPKAEPENWKVDLSIPPGYGDGPQVKNLFYEIEATEHNIFITGKAGTGKSTFLRYLTQNTSKSFAVVAPTGIAAINAGGTTVHSLFRLPVKPLTVGDDAIPIFEKADPKSRLLRGLELLVIDEASMITADVFEAIDFSLKRNRRDGRPFGGVQVVLIGDLFQLPPVPPRQDQFENHAAYQALFPSRFFFSTRAYRQGLFRFVEFTTIYRQTDPAFTGLLNRLRLGSLAPPDYNVLAQRVVPTHIVLDQSEEQLVMSLVTTNHAAAQINDQKLQRLHTPVFAFEATTEGIFEARQAPVPQRLEVKTGAQVVFVKNDITGLETENEGKIRRFVNGTVGRISRLEQGLIEVELSTGFTFEVDRETWENVNFRFDSKKNRVDKEVKGTFTQYPFRLAWAITIHKSQGLTFNRCHVDMGRGAFEHGQTYVALSRVRSLEGLTLGRNLRPADIRIDPEVVDFFNRNMALGSTPGHAHAQDVLTVLVERSEFAMAGLALYHPLTPAQLGQYAKLISPRRSLQIYINPRLPPIPQLSAAELKALLVDDYPGDGFFEPLHNPTLWQNTIAPALTEADVATLLSLLEEVRLLGS